MKLSRLSLFPSLHRSSILFSLNSSQLSFSLSTPNSQLFLFSSTMLWVDNHRPKTLDKVLIHEDIAQNLKKLVSEQDCPHLFYGPPGSGKKTLIMALLREMFGASAEKEPPAPVIDSNGAVTGHIILTTIGGKNGEPKQDTMMKEMHKQGITINDISKVLKTVPIHRRIVPTIKAIHAARVK